MQRQWEEQLSKKRRNLDEMRAFWDGRAKEFSRMEVTESDETMRFLRQNMNPEGKTVADIGFGAGRYLEALAKSGMEIHGVELSSEMYAYALERLQKNAVSFDSRNLLNCAWEEVELEKFGVFDLVFLSNSPVISSVRDLDAVLSIAREGVLMTGHIRRTDSLLSELLVKFGIPENRDYVGNVVPVSHILLEKGYYPELHFYRREISRRYSLEECVEKYSAMLFGAGSDEDRKRSVEETVRAFGEESGVNVSFSFLDAMLYVPKER